MPKKIPRISEAEWIVANIVWEQPRITSAEVLDRLPTDVVWKQKTVNTFLTRLAQKGVLGVERDGKANIYSPKLSRDACVQEVSSSLFARIFGGAPAPLLAHFCQTATLSAKEIDELRAILQSRQEEGREK